MHLNAQVGSDLWLSAVIIASTVPAQALRELEESLQRKTEEFKRLEQENLSLKHRHSM